MARSLRKRPASPSAFVRLTFRRGNLHARRASRPTEGPSSTAPPGTASPAEIFTVRTDSVGIPPGRDPAGGRVGVSSKGELAVLLKKTNLLLPVGPGTLARVPIGGGDARERSSRMSGTRTGLRTARIWRSSVALPNGKRQIEYPIGTVLAEGQRSRVTCSAYRPKGDLVAFIDGAGGANRHDDRSEGASADSSPRAGKC